MKYVVKYAIAHKAGLVIKSAEVEDLKQANKLLYALTALYGDNLADFKMNRKFAK